MSLHKLVDHLIWETHLDFGRIKVWILLLSCLLVSCELFLLQLLDHASDFFAKFIVKLLSVINHRLDSQVRNAVALGEKLGKVGLSSAWWAADVDLEWEEASVEIELFVQ